MTYMYTLLYLFEIVQAVHDWCLSGWQLRENIKQLQYNILMVVDDGKMESTAEDRERRLSKQKKSS